MTFPLSRRYANHVAFTQRDQRYVFSREIYCDYPETCGIGGDTSWGEQAIQSLSQALGVTAIANGLRGPLTTGTVDTVFAFGPVVHSGPNSRTIVVRREYDRGARIDRCWLSRGGSGWRVDSAEAIAFATRADSIIER
jgi:hypothetical protein